MPTSKDRAVSPLRPFVPRSLLGRSLLILGLPVIAVQLISLWFFYDRHVQNVSRRMAQNLASNIQLAIDHMRDYPRVRDRDWILSALGAGQGLRATFHPGRALDGREHRAMDGLVGREVVRQFRQILSADFVIDGDYDDRSIRIRVAAPGGLLDIVTRKKKIRPITTELFVAWSIGASVVLLLIGGLFMLNQVRPIRELAAAADRFGKGRDVPDFKPWGATEVRQAAAAFLTMRERLRRQMAQRTEMLAGVSHDLRTPITRLKLALALEPDSPSTAALRRDVEEMEQMVEEYIAFARGEGLEQAVEANLVLLVREVAAAAQQDGTRIDLALPSGLRATFRPNGFRRALTNIVGNAVRAADTVRIGAGRRGDTIQVVVDDDGPGIPADRREDAFRAFHRLDSARNRDEGGVGLGLTVARDILRGHGGDVVLADSPLGGLRAILRFPV